MGAWLSSLVPEPTLEGYHILHVNENSPAKQSGLEAFFDFIVAFCGVALTGDDDAFLDLLKNTKDKEVELKVFSVKTNKFRNVRIVPNIDSNGEISLGLTIHFRAINDIPKYVHHVLKVPVQLPATDAGLRPFSDYIIGFEAGSDVEDMNFKALIAKNDQQPVKLFVFNSKEGTCRAVMFKPSSAWKFGDSLGDGIGTGRMRRMKNSQLAMDETKETSA